MRLKSHHPIQLSLQVRVERVGSVDNPIALLELMNRWSEFWIRIEATEKELLHFLRVSLIKRSKGRVEPFEESVTGIASAINEVERCSIHLRKRKILYHYHQYSDSQAVDISRSHLISFCFFNLSWSIHWCASGMINSGIDLFRVSQINQGKLVFPIENYIIRLDVQVSKSVAGMNIVYRRAQLLDEVTL